MPTSFTLTAEPRRGVLAFVVMDQDNVTHGFGWVRSVAQLAQMQTDLSAQVAPTSLQVLAGDQPAAAASMAAELKVEVLDSPAAAVTSELARVKTP